MVKVGLLNMIRRLDVVDLPMNRRRITWCTKREGPLFNRSDRLLVSEEGGFKVFKFE